MNEENMDRLNFRGKPGESVPTTVLRDGKEMDISVARGVISASYSKSQVLTNMEMEIQKSGYQTNQILLKWPVMTVLFMSCIEQKILMMSLDYCSRL